MSLSFRRTRSVLKKELIQLKRDRSTFALILMIPIVQLLLFGYAINNDPKHLPAAILSRDNSVFARSIVTAMHNSEYFDFVREIRSDREGEELLKRGEVLFVVTIPENFARDLVKGLSPSILLESDASDPTAVVNAGAAVSGIVDSALAREITGPLAGLKAKPGAAQIEVHRMYNPENLTRYNIIPGLIAVILMITGIMMTALSLTRERERGTMENMLSMPVKPLEVMAGKIVPFVGIGFFQAAAVIVAAKLLFGVPILGSLWTFNLALFIFIVCNLATGFAISSAAKNQLQALQMTVFVFLPSIMLSGFIFPFLGMPGWARVVGGVFPMTYFLRIARGIMLKGNGFMESWPNIWPMLIIMLAVTAVAMKVYRRTLD